MTHANKGEVVKVHYSGTLENGKVFCASPKDNPLEFKIGEGRVMFRLRLQTSASTVHTG